MQFLHYYNIDEIVWCIENIRDKSKIENEIFFQTSYIVRYIEDLILLHGIDKLKKVLNEDLI